MYFVTQTDTKDQKFRKYAAFFIEKYPLAFGGRVTYYTGTGKGQRAADTGEYTKLEQVTGVKYTFEDDERAEAFQKFEAKVSECLNTGAGEAAEFLLKMLLETRDTILELQTSTKHADCTIQRFYLLLMPLISMAEETNYKTAKAIASAFIELLLESGYSLRIKVEVLVQLYNSVHSNSGLKSYAFEKLVELCTNENCLEIMIGKAREIVADSKDWNLTVEERRSLYRTVARSLDQQNDSS